MPNFDVVFIRVFRILTEHAVRFPRMSVYVEQSDFYRPVYEPIPTPSNIRMQFVSSRMFARAKRAREKSRNRKHSLLKENSAFSASSALANISFMYITKQREMARSSIGVVGSCR